ncbi:putative spermidine/putrescine ABC transporter, permease protein [Leptolyngbya boryana NIES-2135]|jgi:putative spermidine/putrescine transport system permease protein|uniref:Putative spermidine/putrescine ABC transporter, permease protein n=1 Tax=Leptolyngbya boryana NIES-2135 TaxID=1973484 RepID=A0A1Z4JJE7_LEPBY|nr:MULTISPECIES: ABC transporter permease [Leptolyngbya]BAY56882.1 putative spermidine/putrescine ABC transporter, permease protein [Leptolyngbya boryana NIES-2135]MBD2368959.1 ABC transporter permease [Leptolyngbya sp. FACHB-161]MBD2375833.1 ABC transporter permease [Leptolyngbya sp. FACHB-238]MBD2399947.1 ABC transporter permease [Leptolyngbya sp. FACHB-239]MBD2406153.1 ABC transporter permease [Leptolyngbya sp. FACHB-402]
MQTAKKPFSYYLLAGFFGLFVLFLYGSMFAVFILSLQGPEGSLTFPMKGFSFYWLGQVFQQQRVGNFVDAFWRSLFLGLLVSIITVTISVMSGLAFRDRFKGSTALFYLAISSLIVPSILISLGIGIVFSLLDLSNDWYTSALGGHLTWSLPFAFLIMLGIFGRFNPAYEEAARDLGASEMTTFWQVVFPLIASSVIGVGLLGFTLSYDEFTRTSLISGETNTLPLEIFGMTTNVTSPALYALGTLTTLFSFGLIAISIFAIQLLSDRQTKPKQ